MKRIAALLVGALLGPLFAGAPLRSAEIFRWLDEGGVVHFTDTVREIPERFRATATRFKTDTRLAPLPPPLDKASLQFEKKGELMVVPAKLNDKSAARFVVDTGASYTIISQAAAKELQIDFENNPTIVPFHTANGTIQAPLVSLKSIEIGGLELKNVTVAVHDIFPDAAITGLLGQNVISQFRVDIDNKNGVLYLEKK